MSIRQRMKAELKRAMKARNSHSVAMLRSLLSAIDNAEAVDMPDEPLSFQGHSPDVPRRVLSEAEMVAIVQREAAAHQAALDDYERLGRSQEAERLRAELAVVEALLDP